MLPIIICEDNSIQREKIKAYIKEITAKEQYDYSLALCTGKVQEVIDFLNYESNFPCIYILDVDLQNKINGIKLAEIIRKKDISGYIIFITTHSEMTFLTFKYKVGAIDYIIKDNGAIVKERLSECLKYIDEIHSSKASKENYITFKQDDRIINIALNDIFFIETSTNSHKIIIHEENRQIEIYNSLSDIESSLSKDFYRCHRSYLVNRKKIKEIDKKNRMIIMTNGEQCMASFRYIGGLTK